MSNLPGKLLLQYMTDVSQQETSVVKFVEELRQVLARLSCKAVGETATQGPGTQRHMMHSSLHHIRCSLLLSSQ